MPDRVGGLLLPAARPGVSQHNRAEKAQYGRAEQHGARPASARRGTVTGVWRYGCGGALQRCRRELRPSYARRVVSRVDVDVDLAGGEGRGEALPVVRQRACQVFRGDRAGYVDGALPRGVVVQGHDDGPIDALRRHMEVGHGEGRAVGAEIEVERVLVEGGAEEAADGRGDRRDLVGRAKRHLWDGRGWRGLGRRARWCEHQHAEGKRDEGEAEESGRTTGGMLKHGPSFRRISQNTRSGERHRTAGLISET